MRLTSRDLPIPPEDKQLLERFRKATRHLSPNRVAALSDGAISLASADRYKKGNPSKLTTDMREKLTEFLKKLGESQGVSRETFSSGPNRGHELIGRHIHGREPVDLSALLAEAAQSGLTQQELQVVVEWVSREMDARQTATETGDSGASRVSFSKVEEPFPTPKGTRNTIPPPMLRKEPNR